MSKLKKVLLMGTAYVLVAALAIGGTVAYLQDTDSDVNVMTLGNVQIAQHEYERVVDKDGNYTTIDVAGVTSYELKEFTQGKPLLPFVGSVTNGYDSIPVRLAQLGHNSRGGMDVLPAKNVQDKFVVVENTGKTDAYVRTIVAFEAGSVVEEDWYKIVKYSAHFTWKETQNWFVTEINGNNYYLVEFVYNGYQDIQHPNGVLTPGDYTYNSLAQVYLFDTATNEDCEALDGNKNGTFDILVLSQAVQAAGFENAKTALDAGFGVFNEANVKSWFGDLSVPNYNITADDVNKVLTELPDGNDITKKVTKIVYGKTAEYPEIVNGGYETATIDNATAYYVPNGADYELYMLSDGVIFAPVNSKNLFANMSKVTEIDTSNLDFSHVQNALCMFYNCTNLKSLDTENWDVSNMTNMQSMFYGCNNLEDIDVSNWDTSNVTNMRMVFFRCYELPNDVLKGVENWDVSNVTNFYSMFKHARGLTSLDLSNWDTSNATNMSHLFANISGLEYLDLSGFDTSKVTDMSWMFYENLNLKTIVVGDGWTTEAENSGLSPFYRDLKLVGGNGTTWEDACNAAGKTTTKTDLGKQYAIVDGTNGNIGLLTKAN